MLGSEALCWASVKYGRISHFLFAYIVFLLFYIQSWWMPTPPSSPWRQDKHVPVCLFTFFVGSVAALSSPHSRVGCVGTVRVQLVSSVVLLADLRQVVHAQAAQLLCDGTLTLSDMCTHKSQYYTSGVWRSSKINMTQLSQNDDVSTGWEHTLCEGLLFKKKKSTLIEANHLKS